MGGDHPLRQPCARILAAAGRRALDATTTVEVVQEFVHVYGRRRGRPQAVRLGRAWATVLSPLISVTRADLDRGLDLYERHPRLGAFDAVLAATALERGADALVSADSDFAEVAGLRHVHPQSPALDELLGS